MASIKGNNIISVDEEKIARYLKDRNYSRVNANSAPVHPRIGFYALYGKRLLDLIIISPAIAILSPVLLILAVCNLVIMGKPVFYKQTRVGLNGKPFDMLKFRSMKNAMDKNGRQLPANQRLTRYGRFIRRYSLDELGNFFNILKGEMSIIGPRALPVFYHDRMSERHMKRELVRPGLECPRVIEMEEDEVGYYQIQFENDIWYVENISLFTDIKMVFALVKMVSESKERSKHADVGTFFVGYNDEGIALSLRLAKEQYPDQFASYGNEGDHS